MSTVSFTDYSTWHLANMADCGSPDRPDGLGLTPPPAHSTPSPGAVFLRRVADATAEAIEYATDEDEGLDEVPHEVADGAVPVYTGELWATFVDLAGYNEDPSDYSDSDDMTGLASICLYIIAERLVVALIEAWWDENEDDES